MIVFVVICRMFKPIFLSLEFCIFILFCQQKKMSEHLALQIMSTLLLVWKLKRSICLNSIVGYSICYCTAYLVAYSISSRSCGSFYSNKKHSKVFGKNGTEVSYFDSLYVMFVYGVYRLCCLLVACVGVCCFCLSDIVIFHISQ